MHVRRPPILARAAGAAALLLVLAAPAPAVGAPGDVLVADRNFDGDPTYTGAVLRVPGAGGAAARLTTPGLGQPNGPSDLAYEASGSVLVSDYGQVLRMTPATGAIDPTPATTGGGLTNVPSLAVRGDGRILVVDSGPSSDPTVRDGQIYSVNPTTGDQTPVLGAGDGLYQPNGSAVGPDGDLFVTQIRSVGGADVGEVLRIDPDTGTVGTVISGGALTTPLDVAFAGDGRLLVLDPQYAAYPGAIVSVDPEAPTPGTTAVFTSLQGTPIARGLSLAVDRDGDAIVGGEALTGTPSVWRVDLATAAVTSLANGFDTPTGLVVEPDPPPLTLTGPTGAVNSATQTAIFSSPGAALTCTLDGGPVVDPCASPYELTGLAPGAHTFTVTAQRLGLDTTASLDFVVDLAAPDTSIGTGPAPGAVVRTTTPTYQLVSSEPDSAFRCAVDDRPLTPCVTPWSPDLDEGARTLRVAAVDAAGNQDPTPVTRTVVVDSIAPTTTITGGPEGPVADTTPTLTFTVADALPNAGPPTAECAVDDGAFTPCTSAWTTPGLTPGAHVLRVRAVDAAGNPDASPATRDVVVDTAPPETGFSSGPVPGAAVTTTTPSYGLSSSESPATFSCAVDAGTAAPCDSPWAPELAQGPHTLRVTASDAAGNADATPATRTVTVDTVAPTTAIAVGPEGRIADATPTLGFTVADAAPNAGPVTAACAVDAGAYAPCTSPWTTPALPDGAHVLRVRAVDAAGTPDATPATREVVVDTTAPVATIASGPTPAGSATPAFGLAAADQPAGPGADAVTFECALDDGAFASCPASYTAPALAPGEHRLRVRATDAVGNRQSDATAATLVFAVAAPVDPGGPAPGGPVGPGPAGPGPGTGTTPGPGSTPTPFVRLRSAATIRRATLRRSGLTVRVSLGTAGRTVTTLKLGTVVLAKTTRTLTPGTTAVRLRLTTAGRRALARRTGRRTLRVATTGPGGKATAKVVVR